MTRRAKFPFIGMEVGETATYKHEDFNVYSSEYRNFYSSLSQYKKLSGTDFLCVTVPGGVLMERVA